VPDTARQFGRAIIMPNLKPPVTTAAQARRIASASVAAMPAGASFEPLMTLYLTDNTAARRNRRAESGFVRAQAVSGRRHHQQRCRRHRHPKCTYKTLEVMQEHGLLLLVHGEVTDSRSICSTAKPCSSTGS
jgi:dihydroorotase